MAKARKPTPTTRRETRDEFEAVCRATLVGLREPVGRVFRRIVRAAPKTTEPLYLVIWELGDYISVGLEDNRPAFQGDFIGFDEIDWRAWDRRLGADAWHAFYWVLVRVFGEWWAEAGGADYSRRAVIGEHDIRDWVDLLTGKPARV